MSAKPDLDEKMIQRADRDGLAPDHVLRVRAKELQDIENEFLSASHDEGKAKRMLGAWARARRAWSEYTGEPLL